MTEKWDQIQGKWDLVRVSERVRVIRVRVIGVLLNNDLLNAHSLINALYPINAPLKWAF